MKSEFNSKGKFIKLTFVDIDMEEEDYDPKKAYVEIISADKIDCFFSHGDSEFKVSFKYGGSDVYSQMKIKKAEIV